MEALGATSTLPELAGPEETLKPSWLLRFFIEFGVLRDYNCFLEQDYMRTDLTSHPGRWLGHKHNSKYNSHISARSVMSVYPQILLPSPQFLPSL